MGLPAIDLITPQLLRAAGLNLCNDLVSAITSISSCRTLKG